MICLLVFVSSGSKRSFGGTGSSADPWKNTNAYWDRAAAATSPITALWADVQSVRVAPYAFWSTNPRFQIQQGFYVGFQTNAMLAGSLGGYEVAKGAAFSLWGSPPVGPDQRTVFRLLDTLHCSDGADQSIGVHCISEYAWITGNAYRLTVEQTQSTSPAQCPTVSPTDCRVYTGYIAPLSNIFSRTQIGQWSINSPTFGDVGSTFQFLEPFHGCTSDKPEGHFVLPYYAFAGTYSASGPLHGSDSSKTAECGRIWIDGFGSIRIKIV